MKITCDSIDRSLRSILLFSVLFLVACQPTLSPEVQVTGRTMGTSYSVKVISDELQADDLKRRIDARLVALNDVFSTYLPDSELSRLNGTRGPQPLSDELAAVLRLSAEIYALSGGAFDVTVGPLVNLWGFGPGGPANGVPEAALIEETRQETGFDKVVLDGNRIRRTAPVVIDLSAIAKGYAVDEIASLLESVGAERYMVEIGGEVRAAGINARGGPWVIGIETPDATRRQLQRTLPLVDLGIATSGDYRNFFEYEGRHYSHTIDPKTGWPVTHQLASVTVLHPRAAYADALATAFSVMGIEQTLEIAEQQGILIFAIMRTETGYKEIYSSAMQAYLAGFES